jgi:hypothetical protein
LVEKNTANSIQSNSIKYRSDSPLASTVHTDATTWLVGFWVRIFDNDICVKILITLQLVAMKFNLNKYFDYVRRDREREKGDNETEIVATVSGVWKSFAATI